MQNLFSDRDKYTILILFLLSSIVQLFLIGNFPISLSIDSYAYINNTSNTRPIGYNLFLFLTGVHLTESFIFPIYLQLIVTIMLPIITFLTFYKIHYFSALITALFFLLNLYVNTMSLQIMSESIFIFGITILIVFCVYYYKTKKLIYLMLALATIIIFNEVRQSLQVSYFILLFLSILNFLNTKKKTFLIHFLIILLISLIYISIKSSFSRNNSASLIPFFAVHYLPKINTNNGNIELTEYNKYPLLHPKNGKNSEIFFSKVNDFISDQRNFELMAAKRDPNGNVLTCKNKKKCYFQIREIFKGDFKIKKSSLLKDIIYNSSKANHRWPQLVLSLYSQFGREHISKLLNLTIFEGFIKNQKVLINFYPKHFLKAVLDQNLLHDNLYWYFIPKVNKLNRLEFTKLDIFPFNKNTYAAWVYNMEAKTGLDTSSKETTYWSKVNYGSRLTIQNFFTKTMENIINYKKYKSFEKFEKSKNKYLLTKFFIMNILSFFTNIIIFSIPLLILFSLFSKNFFIVIPFLFCFLIITSVTFITSLGPRNIIMFLPLLSPIFFTGMMGACNFMNLVRNKIIKTF